MSFENSRYMKSAREAEAEGGKDKLRARIEALEAELASLRSEREGMREGNSSVGSPAEAGTPSPSGGPVLRDGGADDGTR